jgi:hypothetical protein
MVVGDAQGSPGRRYMLVDVGGCHLTLLDENEMIRGDHACANGTLMDASGT